MDTGPVFRGHFCETLFRVKKGIMLSFFLLTCGYVNFQLSARSLIPSWFSPIAHFSAGCLLTWSAFLLWRDGSPASYAASGRLWRWCGLVAGVALGGVLWEIFEYLLWLPGIFRAHLIPSLIAVFIHLYGVAFSPFLFNEGAWIYHDTMWDLMMDLAGGSLTALFFALRRNEVITAP